MDSLYPDILRLVKRRRTPYDMLKRIQKAFVGSIVDQKLKLMTKLREMRFQGNYFSFLNDFETIVDELNGIDGVASWHEITNMFLKKLPRSLEDTIQPLFRYVVENEEDREEIWDNVFDNWKIQRK